MNIMVMHVHLALMNTFVFQNITLYLINLYILLSIIYYLALNLNLHPASIVL